MKVFQNISAHDAQTLLAAPSTQLVDIRDEFAFRDGHIENARRIDNSNVGEFIAIADKTAPLIVCCYHGISSQSVAQFFIEQGFVEVYSLSGGFEEWKTRFPYVR
ncbi:MAG: thiosulfate sulfurtransferase GlpE [Spongiibacteraceae bacterium]